MGASVPMLTLSDDDSSPVRLELRPRAFDAARDVRHRSSYANVSAFSVKIAASSSPLRCASQAAVSKYMIRHRKPPSQTWWSFLDNHVEDLVSVDFFTLPTALRSSRCLNSLHVSCRQCRGAIELPPRCAIAVVPTERIPDPFARDEIDSPRVTDRVYGRHTRRN